MVEIQAGVLSRAFAIDGTFERLFSRLQRVSAFAH